MATGAGWGILLRIFDRTIGILSISILARLLTPADFGVVALAFSVVTIVEAFGALNVETALIRIQDAGRADWDTAWTIRMVSMCALGLVIAVSASPAADFFGDTRVETVLYVLALSSAIGGFQNIGTVEFQKELQFSRDFTYKITTRLAATAVALTAAYILRDYWALVIGMACRSMFRVAASYVVHPYRPKVSMEKLRTLLGFSSWLLAQNLISSVNSRLSIIILGRLTALDLVSFFSVGKEIASLATTELQAPIRRALYPGFAKLSANLENLVQTFLGSFGIVSILGLPVAIGIGLTADYAVHLLLGSKWTAAIPIIQIMAVSGAIQSLRTGSHLIYLSLNRPRMTLVLALVGLAISLPALVLGVEMAGIIGAAWATVAISATLLVADYAILLRMIPLSLADLMAALWRPVLATSNMAAVLLMVRASLPPATEWSAALVGLVVCIPLGAVVYAVTILILWNATKRPQGAERTILANLGRLKAT